MAAEDVALRLIQKNGRPISLRVNSRTDADPTKPWADQTITTSDIPTVGVFLDENAKDLAARVSAVSRLVLSAVETNGVQVLIPAKGLSVVPTTAMQIVDGGRVLEIKQVGTLAPGLTPVMYTCKVEN